MYTCHVISHFCQNGNYASLAVGHHSSISTFDKFNAVKNLFNIHGVGVMCKLFLECPPCCKIFSANFASIFSVGTWMKFQSTRIHKKLLPSRRFGHSYSMNKAINKSCKTIRAQSKPRFQISVVLALISHNLSWLIHRSKLFGQISKENRCGTYTSWTNDCRGSHPSAQLGYQSLE